jgi:hypothetical protein
VASNIYTGDISWRRRQNFGSRVRQKVRRSLTGGRASDQGVPHISLVFGEMWETRTLIWVVEEFGMAKNSQVERRGIPHLAKKRARYPDFLCVALSVTVCAAFIKESRMKLVRPTGLNRKSGGMGHPRSVVRTVLWSRTPTQDGASSQLPSVGGNV